MGMRVGEDLGSVLAFRGQFSHLYRNTKTNLIASYFQKLAELLQSLLALPSLNIPFLTAAAYTTITAILAPSVVDPTPTDTNSNSGTATANLVPTTLPPAHFPTSLATLLSLPPAGDADAVPWIGAVGACLRAWGEACRDDEVLEEVSSTSFRN